MIGTAGGDENMKPFAIASLFLVFGIAAAQEMEPPKEMKAVEFLAGNWSGTETYLFGGQKSEGKSQITSATALGGHFIRGQHKMSVEGMDMEGMHILGYSPEAKKYRAWWFDSMSNDVLEMEGDLKGNVLTMTSKPTPMPGLPKPVRMRATWTNKSAKELDFRLEIENEGKWNLMIEGHYQRG
jgi:hypothetical protein